MAIKNGQSRETGNIDKKNKKQKTNKQTTKNHTTQDKIFFATL